MRSSSSGSRTAEPSGGAGGRFKAILTPAGCSTRRDRDRGSERFAGPRFGREAYAVDVSFVVARNPDPDSRLPYLIRLPIDGGLILKVRDTWPRTSRVFCARVDDGWPTEAEIVEEVPVTLCRRRGVAIDLVLDRPRENRSQFVFTVLPPGREGIFWQTRKVVTTARPGARIPGRRASGISELVIVVDTREQYPYQFSK